MSVSSARRVSVQVNLDALSTNLAVVRGYQPSAKVFSVLKADAYGHGAVECAVALTQAGTDAFATVFPGEAEQLRQAGIKKPILVLQGPHTQDDIKLLTSKNLWAVIHDESQRPLLDHVPAGEQLVVWVKVDTGMGRMGIKPAALPRLLNSLAKTPRVICAGVLSHFANADNPGDSHAAQQIDRFNSLDVNIAAMASAPRSRSLANSAAVMSLPQTGFDWVRPGIMLYGSSPLPLSVSHQLTPVMRVSAPLIAIKQRLRGDGIGYAQTWHCPENMSVGYASIGYGDGLPRVLQGARVLLNGKLVPVIGRVSMDSIALDLRGCDAAVGDSVTLWGAGCPVEQLASAAGTISYELLCNIKGTRRYVGGAPGFEC